MNDLAARVSLGLAALSSLVTGASADDPSVGRRTSYCPPGLRNPVLLIHGFSDSARSMERMKRWLEARGWESFTMSLVPSDGSVSLEELAKQIATHVSKTFNDNQKVDLVGFSMGGLVCRYYVQRLGGVARVDRLITVSTPNHGTWLAYLSNKPGCVEMRPASRFLVSLNGDAELLKRPHFDSIWTPLDLMILPSSSSRLPTGRNMNCWVPAHPLMILQRGVLEKIEKLLLTEKLQANYN